MPELPEVEIMTRNMARWCAGRRLVRLERVDPALLPAVSLAGAALGTPWRRGKHLCLPVGADAVLVMHFRMTGKVVLESSPRRHVRARLHLDSGDVIAFIDSRRLGQVALVPPAALPERFCRLGPEPWPMQRSAAWWAEQLRGLRGAIKPALMRQDRVAGLGNIAASEICFAARLDPCACVPALTARQWQALAAAVPALIERVLAAESGPEIAYIHESGLAASPFSVYGRAQLPCLSGCGDTIQRTVQSGRATFRCPTCQRGEPSRSRP